MDFKESERIDVTKHIERKGRFNYLSWPFAVSEFRKACPNGMWQVNHPASKDQPYFESESGCFVEVTVYPDMDTPKIRFTQVHPVLDNKNKTLDKPDAFQINTSIQRCLVKAIALATGIGLHIYAGEDLPPIDEKPPKQKDASVVDSTKLFNEMYLEIDKCTESTTMAKWFAENAERIAAGLNDDDKTRLRALYKEYSDIFKKEKNG